MTAHEAIAAIKAEIERQFWSFGQPNFGEDASEAADRVLAFLGTLEAEEKEEDVPDEVAHFAFYRHNDDPKSLYLSNVFVKENDRGNGYGNNILTMAEAAARSVGARCIILKAKKGSDAMAWYARHGFAEIEEVGEFVWMRKSISEEKVVVLGEIGEKRASDFYDLGI